MVVEARGDDLLEVEVGKQVLAGGSAGVSATGAYSTRHRERTHLNSLSSSMT